MVGHCELIFGSMYCGKSEELLRRLKRAEIGGQKVLLFKPSIDNRYGKNIVATHDANSTQQKIEKILEPYLNERSQKVTTDIILEAQNVANAIPVNHSSNILSFITSDYQVIGIDELQFFDEGIINVIRQLISQGKRVICSGLDMAANGEPFGDIIPYIACISKRVDKLHAICIDCGEEAYISHKISDEESNEKQTIDVGSNGKYIALCENCREKREKR